MKKLLFILIAAMVSSAAFAQRTSRGASKELLSQFTEQCDTADNYPIRYRMAQIGSDSIVQPILVIFLHSAGGRGDDNKTQLGMPAVEDILRYLQAKNMSAYFLVPQCPRSASWNGIAPGDGNRRRGSGSSPNRPLFGDKETLADKTPFVNHLRPWLDAFVSANNIGPHKIYILGASMGAAGVWEIVAQNPEFFSGAMAASGMYRGKQYSNLLDTPIICTAGTEEDSHDKCKKLVEKLVKAGGKTIFESLDGMNHIDACNRAFTSERLDKLFGTH